MTTYDSRIILRDPNVTSGDELIVQRPGQPADYVHTDGTVWTWRERWRPVGGTPHRGEGLAPCT
jgi:hypothetical protein